MSGLLTLVGCAFEHGAVPADAGSDTDNSRDTDGDGVVDGSDNCPTVANPDQRDHDSDGHGDACDHCPHLPSAADPDQDGDGVGDACDPRPSTVNDRIVLWQGFYDGNAIDNWVSAGATANWSVMNGAVHQDDPAPNDRLLLAPGSFQRVYVASAFQITSLGTGATLGLCSGVIPGNQQFYCCTIRTSGPVLQASSHFEFFSTTWPGTVAVGDRVEMVQNTTTANRCEASQGTASATKSTALGGTNGSVQLYTASAGAAFDYLFVVEIGN
jgi:hypothetical protein